MVQKQMLDITINNGLSIVGAEGEVIPKSTCHCSGREKKGRQLQYDYRSIAARLYVSRQVIASRYGESCKIVATVMKNRGRSRHKPRGF